MWLKAFKKTFGRLIRSIIRIIFYSITLNKKNRVIYTYRFLGLINSKLLTVPNKIWFKFGMFLGSIIAPIVMAIIFFIVVTPIGLFMKFANKDLLNKKFNKEKETYWIKYKKLNDTMKKQFWSCLLLKSFGIF